MTLVVHNVIRYSHGVCCCRFATGVPRLSGIANGPVSSGSKSAGQHIASCSSSTLPGLSMIFGSRRATGWRSFAVTGLVDTASGSTTSGASASTGRRPAPGT